MASNFKISSRQRGRTIRIFLSGDFDGSSALELLNFIRDHCSGRETVVLYTDALKGTHPFGRDMFRKNLCLLNGTRPDLIFKGRYAGALARES